MTVTRPPEPARAVADAIGPVVGPGSDPDRDRLRVWRYLRALGASAAEADDLTQETLLAALRAPRDGVANPDAFVLGIARNQWLRSRRWWRRHREREIADAVDQLWVATAAADDGDELIARLRECLGRLQPRARLALELHYRDGLRWQEIGPRIGLQQNGTKTLAQRSRQALRQCIENHEGSDA